MKRFLFLLLMLPLLTSSTPLVPGGERESVEVVTEEDVQTNFCKGWDDGYCEGWKDVKGKYAICPVTPICPIPDIDESSESYRDGYNRGFKAGYRAANE